MIDPDSLNVWFEDQLVGHLWRNATSAIGFRYASEWITESGFAISQTLSITNEEYSPEDAFAHRFFANLLPEGGVRDHIVRDLKIPNTDFELLRAIGGECAGALSILPVERTPSTNNKYRALDEVELEQLITRRGQIYTALPPEHRPRLSLAGAQDKCPVLLKDGHYFLPEREAPSSHILKFEVSDYRHLPAYETFTTLLAKQIGLPVVNIELHQLHKISFAQIERYDRIWESAQLVRLHQEDFCQALGYGFDKKYQEHGGPSFANCYQLVQDVSTDPVIDTQNLLRWQIFNYLAGNSDGHAKNLSLLYFKNGEIRLAPYYDLICTRAIKRIDEHLAFDIGGQRDPGHVTDKHWQALAEQCDVSARFLKSLLNESTNLLLDNLETTKNLFEKQYGEYPALQRIEQVVRQQCR